MRITFSEGADYNVLVGGEVCAGGGGGSRGDDVYHLDHSFIHSLVFSP
jgi:hypothetical protein